MNETILQIINRTPFGLLFLEWTIPLVWKWSKFTIKMFNDHFENDFSEENLKRKFLEHSNKVIKKCPKDKLLTFEVKEGWKPLCEFLGKDIPKVDFPRVNDMEQAKYMIGILRSMLRRI